MAVQPVILRTDVGIHNAIATAKSQLAISKRPIDTPHIVAALSFGFLTALLSKRLTDSIWLAAVHKAFPEFYTIWGASVARSQAAKLFDEIRNFRNRVFHHEPLFARKSLQADYDRILEAASWMYPDLRNRTLQQSATCAAMIEGGPPQ